jgi:hypothetical protein
MDATHQTQFPLIEKENISGLHFSKGEVLTNKTAIDARRFYLDEACRLGNEFKGKVKIVFKSDEGIYEVHTTIWNVGDDIVSLKAGVYIPVPCIISIEHL